jgi:hypothetical protein
MSTVRPNSFTAEKSVEQCPVWVQPVWKLKIPKLDEKDILVFDIEIELACNASTSNDLE